jgi:tetratricopeptide (TPR) repeat protein
VLVVLLCLAACGATNERAKNAETIQREEQADKLVDRGKAFASMGDTTRAEQYFAAALDHGADEAKILPMLLETCVRDGRFEAAIEYAKPYLRKHPNDIKTHYVLGTLYSAVGNGRDARDEIDLVVKAQPEDADPHYLLGVLLKDDKDWVGADAQFREYLRISPHGAHAEEARASLLREVPKSPQQDGGTPGVPQLIGPMDTGMSQSSATDGGRLPAH